MDKLPDGWRVAPLWALIYVGRMAALCQMRGALRVVVAPDAWFDEVGGGVDGVFFCPNVGERYWIAIRESAEEGDRWRDVLAHEFAHCLHSQVDQAVQAMGVDMSAYVAAVEQFVPLLGGLVQSKLSSMPNFVIPAQSEWLD